ncbi:hypothetical protein PT7_1355 [Pusillimonas sp. T7-7]|nr:hypothetical protein PT7_1355 [Pusillimonas sp. T7-7]
MAQVFVSLTSACRPKVAATNQQDKPEKTSPGTQVPDTETQ